MKTHTQQRGSAGAARQQVRYLPGLEVRPGRSGGRRETVRHVAEAGSVRINCDGAGRQVRYSLSDRSGSAVTELDGAGACVSRETFYPFGGTAAREGKPAYKTKGYAGKERDATGLLHYGFRSYAPWLMRWLNPDPAGTVDGLNLYRMVRNNPVTLGDKDGRNPEEDIEIQGLDHFSVPDWIFAEVSSSEYTAINMTTSEPEHTDRAVGGCDLVCASVATAVTWGAALVSQRFTQLGLEAAGTPPVVATAMASVVTEPVAAAIGSASFMPGIQGATPGFTTAGISWGLYTLAGGVGNGQAGQFARNNTGNEALGACADVSLVPVIATLETVVFANTEGAHYRANNSQGSWWGRFSSQFWDRMVTGGAMRLIANISTPYISDVLNDIAVNNDINYLESGQPANQLISNLPSIAVASIPNLSGKMAAGWNRLSTSFSNVFSSTHINAREHNTRI
jgi:RHS repeat-associated protein